MTILLINASLESRDRAKCGYLTLMRIAADRTKLYPLNDEKGLRTVKTILMLLATGLACASAFAQEDIEAIDRTSGMGSLRLSFNIAGEPGMQGPAVPHSGHGIEMGLSGG